MIPHGLFFSRPDPTMTARRRMREAWKVSRPSGPSLIELLEPRLRADPVRFYQELHGRPPVYWDNRLRTWVVHRYADAVAALRDPRYSARRLAIRLDSLPGTTQMRAQPLVKAMHRQMLFVDPPDHTRLRGLTGTHFTPRAIEGVRPLVAEILGGLLAELGEPQTIDCMSALADRLPVSVFARMLGLPPEHQDQVRRWSRDFFVFLNGSPQNADQSLRGLRSMANLLTYFQHIGEGRLADPLGLFEILRRAMTDQDQITPADVFANYVFLFGAAHETTTSLIGSGLLRALRDPGLLTALRDDPALAESFVLELLRRDPPVQITHRLATTNLRLGGAEIGQGETVAIVLGAANHDPDQFSDPYTFDPRRRPNHHLSFGYGIHHCLGAALARLETSMVLRAFAARFPAARLTGEQREWNEALFLRRIARLTIHLGPAAIASGNPVDTAPPVSE